MLDPSDETPLFERFSFGNLNDEARGSAFKIYR